MSLFNTATWTGKYSSYTRKWRGYLNYTWNGTASNTQASFTLGTFGIEKTTSGSAEWSGGTAKINVYVNGDNVAGGTQSLGSDNINWGSSSNIKKELDSGFATSGPIYFNRTTSAYTITVTVSASKSGGSAWNGSASSSFTLTVPALPAYTISYNANGGSSTPTAQTKYYNIAIALRGAISRTGYRFGGWKWNNTGNAIAAGTSWNGANAAGTFYAYWNANTYTVAYNGNGATSGSTASSSHTYNTAKNLTPNGFSRTGFTFKGWNTNQTNANNGTVQYTNSQPVSNLTATHGATVTLYAVWQINTYNISYNANGGTGSIPSQTKTHDINITLDNNTNSTYHFSRDDYLLAHWKANDSSGTLYPLGTTYTANSSVVMSAQWVSIKPEVNIETITRVSGDYKLTKDTTVDSNKTYYLQVDNQSNPGVGDHTYDNTTQPTQGSNPSANNYYEATNDKTLPDDEGRSAVIKANFSWINSYNDATGSSDIPINLIQPEVTVTTKVNNVTTTYNPYVTWYSDESLGQNYLVTWPLSSSPAVLYGYIDDMFDIQSAYPIAIIPTIQTTYQSNTLSNDGTETSSILSPAFYTIDFLAGGHGIAFGMPATDPGFYCAMDVFLPLDDISDPTNVEAKLYQAAQAGADILVPSTTTIDLKKILYHALTWN